LPYSFLVAEIVVERGQRLAKLIEQTGQTVVLPLVRIPAGADVHEGDLQPDVRFDELRDLTERAPNRLLVVAARIDDASPGLVHLRLCRFELLDGLECLAGRSADERVGLSAVHRLV
jgi:hypothetical protein